MGGSRSTPVLDSPVAWLVYWADTVLISAIMLAVVAIGLLWVLHARIIRPPVNKEVVGQ